MESFLYLLLETLLIAIMIVSMHFSIKKFGIGPLFIFLGAIQFFQTILSASVYNLYFDLFIFSPGSSILYTSSLFSILLVFHTESIKKTRSLIYGLIFSNIAITILSYITLQQIFIDQYSLYKDNLERIYNFDITVFLIGTSLLYIDSILLIIIYEFLNYKFVKKMLFFKLFISTSIISLFDSCIFYTLSFSMEEQFTTLMLGNIIGKQISVIIFSIIFYFYLRIMGKPFRVIIPKYKKDIIKIFSF
ncbi:VUT family protein [Flavobacterium sp. J27]|uniref:VUT family protein n=1 Tax=Flavobacterium sp. J27 TaxID=2060419 RepID=UPI0010311D53